jgi:uncharacterized membrane protein
MNRLRPGPAAFVAVATVSALLLRCWHMASRPLWLDESWSRWMTEQSWAGLGHAAIRYDTHPPFYYSLLKAWTAIAPSTPAGLRSLSVLAAMAMLPLAWAAAGRIEALSRSRWARSLAVALVAVSPPLVVAAGQARPYALFALAFALALWAALKLVQDSSGRGRFASWALYLGGLEATLWLHSLGALFAASLAGGLFLASAAAGSLRRNLRAFAAVHLLAAIAWLPGLVMLLEQRRGWSASSWLTFSIQRVPDALAHGLALPGAAAWLLLLFAALGAGLMLRYRADRPAAILLLSAAILPAAMEISLSLLLSPVFLPRTLVPSVLPVLMLVAAGLAAIDRFRRPAVAAKAIFALLAAVILALLAAASFTHARAAPKEQWGLLSAWLERRVGAREEIWLLPNEIVMPLLYGGGGSLSGVRGVPADFPAPNHRGPRPSGTRAVPGITDAEAERLAADARARGLTGIWVVSRLPRLFDPGGALPRALGPGRRDMRFAPLIVDHYRLLPTAEPAPPAR